MIDREPTPPHTALPAYELHGVSKTYFLGGARFRQFETST